MSKRPTRKKKEVGFTPDMADVIDVGVTEIINKSIINKLKGIDDGSELIPFTDNIGLGVNQIHCGDTVETMGKLKDGSIDFILTSPPYLASIRKDNHKYPGAKNQIKDNQSVEEYCQMMVY